VSELEAPLQVDVEARGETVVLVLVGELDPHTAPLLRNHLDEVVDDTTSTVVLDVAGLSFIDSSGLRVIIATHKDMDGRNGRLILRSPTATTRRLLDITGLADHLAVE
jgi:anti-sigma B factor antagonist